MLSRTLIFLLISFIEGGSLMAYEIISSRIYTPHFGGTIYVWTSILTITLLGLALGYRNGDRIPLEKGKNRLFLFLLLTSIFVFCSKWIANGVFPAFQGMEIRMAAFLGGLILLLLPMFLLGMVSPIIIRQLSQESNVVGNNSGLVYSVSTIGGVLFSMILVFLVIPDFGVQVSLWIISILLFLAALGVKLIK